MTPQSITTTAFPCQIPRGSARVWALRLCQAARKRGFALNRIKIGILLGANAHAGQERSADGSPYVSHPLQVALLVCHWGGSEDQVLAALNHDAAEDGPLGPDLTLHQLDAELGSNVAALVQILTKNSELDRADRVRDAHTRLLHGLSIHGTGLAAIRLADRAHNTSTAAHLPATKLQRLSEENAALFAPLARQIGAHGLADYLLAGPMVWWPTVAEPFCNNLLQHQPAFISAGSQPDATGFAH